MPRRRSSRLVAALAASVTLVATAGPAVADELDDKKAEAAQITDRLEELEVTASSLDESYNQVAVELSDLEVDVGRAESDVARFEADLARMRGEAGGVALRAYMNSDTGLGNLLGGSAASNEAAQRQGYASVALGMSTSITDQLKATTDDAQTARDVLASKRDRKAELEAELDERRGDVDAAIADHQELQATVQGELAKLVAQEQARREAAEAAATQARIEAEQQAAAAAAAADDDGSSDSGGGSGAGGGGGAAAAAPANGGDDSGGGDGGGSSNDDREDADDDGGSSDDGGGGGAGANVPAPSPGASGAVEAAMSQQGVPWKFATASPGVAFDCSGLTMWAWGQAGVSLPHSSKLQYEVTAHVPADQARPGDLFFFGSPIHHVGLYIGGGQMVNSTQSGDVVRVQNAYRDDLVGVGRP